MYVATLTEDNLPITSKARTVMEAFLYSASIQACIDMASYLPHFVLYTSLIDGLNWLLYNSQIIVVAMNSGVL